MRSSFSGLWFELFSVLPGWSHLTDLLLICQRGWNRQLVLLSWWWTFQKKSHVTLTKVGVPRPFEPLRVSGAVKPVLYQAMIDFRDQTWLRINNSPMMSDAVSHVLYRTFRTVTASKYKEVLFPFTSFADLSCFLFPLQLVNGCSFNKQYKASSKAAPCHCWTLQELPSEREYPDASFWHVLTHHSKRELIKRSCMRCR